MRSLTAVRAILVEKDTFLNKSTNLERPCSVNRRTCGTWWLWKSSAPRSRAEDDNGDRTMHGATCDGCLLIAKASCEMRNLFLNPYDDERWGYPSEIASLN